MKLKLLLWIVVTILMSVGVFANLGDSLRQNFDHDNSSIIGSTSVDNVGNQNGTITGFVSVGGGIIKDALYSDGSSNNIDITDSAISYDGDFAYSVWIKLSDDNNRHSPVVIHKSGAYSYALSLRVGNDADGDDIELGCHDGASDSYFSTGIAGKTGNWINVVVSRDASENNVSIYVNGSYVGSHTNIDCNVTFGDGSPKWELGEFNGANDMTGYIDEVSVWDRTLLLSEVIELYNNSYGISYPYSVSSPTPNLEIDLLFKNVTSSYKTLFLEGDTIYSYINWTWDNGTRISIGDCNFTINGSYIDSFYNSTLELWESNVTYSTLQHGTETIIVNCTSGIIINSTKENITINNIPPIITSINLSTSINYPLPNYTIEYSSDNYTFSFGINDNDIDVIVAYLYNSTGDLLISNNTLSKGEEWVINNSFFLEFNQPFNITLIVNDTASDEVEESYLFNITDTINPICAFVNYSVLNSSTLMESVVCYDENFYSLNVSCTNNAYSFYVDGLDVTNYTYNISISNVVADVCIYEYCDGHTAQDLIGEWELTKFNDKLDIIIDNKIVSTIRADNGEIFFEKEYDRIKFNVQFEKTLSPYKVIYYQTSEDSHYLESEMFKGWVVDSKYKTWFDLNNLQKANVVTIDKGDGLYEFRIYTNADNIYFESTGSLNCVNGTINIGTYLATKFTFGTITLTRNEIFFLVLIFIIGIGFLAYSEYVFSPAMIMTSGIYFIVFGLYFILVAWQFAIMPILFGIGIIWRGITITMLGR